EQRVYPSDGRKLSRGQGLHKGRDIARIEDQQVAAAQFDEGQAVRRERKDMVERERGDDALFAFLQIGRDPRVCLAHVSDQVAVSEHAPLGDTGGAAGILKASQVVVV